MSGMDIAFTTRLKDVGFTDPLIWASFCTADPDSDEALQAFHEMACHLGAGVRADDWAEQAVELYRLSRDEEPRLAKQLGAISGLNLTADLAEHEREHWRRGDAQA